MSKPQPSLRIEVDVANPGQFFACCGLLELADRLWRAAYGWFENRSFCISTRGSLAELIGSIARAELVQLDPKDDMASPMEIGDPFRKLRLDWWRHDIAGGRDLKVWAGSMECVRIAVAMQHALQDQRFHGPDLLDVGTIVYDPANPDKKVEPFYFDARRAENAHSRDVGFSANDLKFTTTAFPAVELLCLVGLQRCLPARQSESRVYDYRTWSQPLPVELLAGVVPGAVPLPNTARYRFENWYRTGQRKHKAFRSAIKINQGD